MNGNTAKREIAQKARDRSRRHGVASAQGRRGASVVTGCAWLWAGDAGVHARLGRPAPGQRSTNTHPPTHTHSHSMQVRISQQRPGGVRQREHAARCNDAEALGETRSTHNDSRLTHVSAIRRMPYTVAWLLNDCCFWVNAYYQPSGSTDPCVMPTPFHTQTSATAHPDDSSSRRRFCCNYVRNDHSSMLWRTWYATTADPPIHNSTWVSGEWRRTAAGLAPAALLLIDDTSTW